VAKDGMVSVPATVEMVQSFVDKNRKKFESALQDLRALQSLSLSKCLPYPSLPARTGAAPVARANAQFGKYSDLLNAL
jgi:hypothetical protein